MPPITTVAGAVLNDAGTPQHHLSFPLTTLPQGGTTHGVIVGLVGIE